MVDSKNNVGFNFEVESIVLSLLTVLRLTNSIVLAGAGLCTVLAKEVLCTWSVTPLTEPSWNQTLIMNI